MLCGNITPWDFICILVNAAQKCSGRRANYDKIKNYGENRNLAKIAIMRQTTGAPSSQHIVILGLPQS
jgi:hypothetical protein